MAADDDALSFLAEACDGDGRRALTALEIGVLSLPKGERLTLEVAQESIQRKALQYDGTGDEHYDAASALIKSIRGSDPTRDLLAGADDRIGRGPPIPRAADRDRGGGGHWQRRSEGTDAGPGGRPRCGVHRPAGSTDPAVPAVAYLALAPKSNAAIKAIDAALHDVRSRRTLPVPMALRDKHYSGAKELGHGAGYLYRTTIPAGGSPRTIWEPTPSTITGGPRRRGAVAGPLDRIADVASRRVGGPTRGVIPPVDAGPRLRRKIVACPSAIRSFPTMAGETVPERTGAIFSAVAPSAGPVRADGTSFRRLIAMLLVFYLALCLLRAGASGADGDPRRRAPPLSPCPLRPTSRPGCKSIHQLVRPLQRVGYRTRPQSSLAVLPELPVIARPRAMQRRMAQTRVRDLSDRRRADEPCMAVSSSCGASIRAKRRAWCSTAWRRRRGQKVHNLQQATRALPITPKFWRSWMPTPVRTRCGCDGWWTASPAASSGVYRLPLAGAGAADDGQRGAGGLETTGWRR